MDHPEQFPLATAGEYLAGIERDRRSESRRVAAGAGAVTRLGPRDAKVDLATATEHLHLLGADPDHPTGIVEVYAPVSGVITDQEITNSSGVQALTAPNPFTISDVSHVWIACDVYENDLAQLSAVVGVEPPNAKRASASTKFEKSSNTHLFFSVR